MKASRKSPKVIRMFESSGRAMKNTPPHMKNGDDAKKGPKKMPPVKTKKAGKKGSKKSSKSNK